MYRALLTLVICFLACKCPAHAVDGKIKVLSTIAMIDDLVKEIGSDQVDCRVLIVGDLDPHSYELVKGDQEKFEEADLIFYNGLGLEHGLSLRKQLQNPKALALGDYILAQHPDLILSSGGQSDPHIWLDISLWQRTIDPIVDALAKLDPVHRPLFIQRGEELKKKLVQADAEVWVALQKIDTKKRYLVTCHSAFDYFARRYLATSEEQTSDRWRSRVASPEGLSPEAQVAFADLQMVIDHIKRHQIGVLFFETNINLDSIKKIQQALAKEGVSVRLASKGLRGDAMGEGSYIDMIKYNVEILVKELNQT